jgi:hypothetical protein
MIKPFMKIAVLLLTAILVGCGSGYEADLTIVPNDSHRHQAALSVEFALLDRFQQPASVFYQGERIEMVLSVTNNSDTGIIFNFDSGQQYDFYVDSLFGQVWAWSDNKFFSAALSHLDIPPYSTVSISEFVDSDRFNIGNYTATGVFVTQGVSASVDFRVD